MKIEYKNPEKRRGIFIWEADVKFFPREGDFSLNSLGNEQVVEKVKKREGGEGLFFAGPRRADKFLLWISQIKDWDSQKVLEVSYNISNKKDYIDKENDNLIGLFDFSSNIEGRKQLKMSFLIESYEVSLESLDWTTKDYDKSSSLYRKYTKSESHLSQTDEIVKAARNITDDGGSSFAKAKQIYNWIATNIKYEMTSKNRGAIKVFQSKTGNSAELSFLFITMMRSVGVPTRLVSGAWGEVEKKQEAHFWAEFYLEGVGWIPVDCAKELFAKLDNKRTIFSKGENIFLDKSPEHSDVFGIKYRRTFLMQPETVYIDKEKAGVLNVKQNKYLLVKG
jgi:transglutaminase-like putative cysteine protease